MTEFPIAAMALDAVSVGQEDDDYLLTCRDHDGSDTIETEAVHKLVHKHGLRVANTEADFEAGEVRLTVTERCGCGPNEACSECPPTGEVAA